MVNKVYSIVLGGGIPAGGPPLGNITQDVIINSANREIKIKSVLWSLQIYEMVAGLPLNLNNQVSQRYNLHIGTGVLPPLITNIFEPSIAFPPALIFNADRILLWQPGRFEFDSLIIKNTITFRYEADNFDALLVMYHRCSIVVETEEYLI